MATILFIDDDIMTLETYEKMVTFLGHTALLADTSDNALEILSRKAADLIFLDRQLSDMDGFEILKKIRANSPSMDIPVIMVSASHNVFAERAKAEGAQDFLSKPLLTADLQELIDQYTTP
jgi:CheY-like chemotaxis protein